MSIHAESPGFRIVSLFKYWCVNSTMYLQQPLSSGLQGQPCMQCLLHFYFKYITLYINIFLVSPKDDRENSKRWRKSQDLLSLYLNAGYFLASHFLLPFAPRLYLSYSFLKMFLLPIVFRSLLPVTWKDELTLF